jgi:hypothetical protein
MARISFVVPPRTEAPDDGYHGLEGVAGSAVRDVTKYSRHHVVGRKYLQLLQVLWEHYGFITYVDARPPPPGGGRHADQPEDHERRLSADTDPRVVALAQMPANADRGTVHTYLFWMPLNLFVGPSADYRTFDPGGGLEPVKPLTLPAFRWAAVHQIPAAMRALGIPVRVLEQERATGDTFTFDVHVSDAVARQTLGDLLGVLADAQRRAAGSGSGGRVRPFRFDEDADWAVVNSHKDGGAVLRLDPTQQYAWAVQKRLVAADRDWAFVAAQPPFTPQYRMILRTPLADPPGDVARKRR